MSNGRAGDRRTAILDSAAELFARKGIAGTTVREIADDVGMLSGSLYHHFESKDEMVRAIITTYVDSITARYDTVLAEHDDPLTVLDRLIHASIHAALEMPHATEIYQASAPVLIEEAAIRDGALRIQRTWIDAIDRGVASGVLRDDIDPKVFYRLLRDAMWLTVRWYDARKSSGYSIDRLADDCTSIFLHGFAR